MDGVTAITIWASNTAINCWIAGQREITWFGERVDRGDSLGDFSPTNTRLRWASARYQSELGGTWKDPNWPIGNQCPWHQHNSNCTYPAAQTLHMWTTYLP